MIFKFRQEIAATAVDTALSTLTCRLQRRTLTAKQQDKTLIFQLMYFSQAAEGLSAAAVDAILATAQAENPQHGITGFLTFNGEEFIQFIEGAQADVERLLANIERDRRNEALITLAVHEAEERSFPDWFMERLADAPRRSPGDREASRDIPPGIASALERMHDRFRDSYRAYLDA